MSSPEIADLVRSFRQVHRAMYHLMRVQADDVGITPVQLLVLRALSEEPNLSLGELADRMELGCSTVSGVVKRLVGAGILQRERLATDQRTIAMQLTKKGQDLVERAFGEDSMMARAMLKILQIPEQDRETLLALNQQLSKVLLQEGEKKKDE